MIGEIGHFALALGCILALVQAILPLIGAHRADARLMALASPLAGAQLIAIASAFGALLWAFAVNDTTVSNVVLNSHSQKPLIYKFSGAWGNHEGSMVLWVLILALCGGAVAGFGRDLPSALQARVIGILGLIAVGFLGFIIFTSNPFERVWPPPMDGQGLNPLLQDLGLALHPPMLYLGYVGYAVTFAFAVAALLEGRVDAAWGRWVRPWSLAAWSFLTLGIALGSWWAYYELGWGGYWFWDPVENASLLPWLIGTALLHSAIVVEKRESLKIWTVLLAILAFGMSLLGTFLVRSGVLNSVHAFANDPARGVFILALLMAYVAGALALFAWRAPKLGGTGIFAPISREGGHALAVVCRYPVRGQNLRRCALLQCGDGAARHSAGGGDGGRADVGLEACRSGGGLATLVVGWVASGGFGVPDAADRGLSCVAGAWLCRGRLADCRRGGGYSGPYRCFPPALSGVESGLWVAACCLGWRDCPCRHGRDVCGVGGHGAGDRCLGGTEARPINATGGV